MNGKSFADRIFVRKESDPKGAFELAFFRNPLLVTAAGANLIAGGCVTLSNGVIMSLLLIVTLPLAGVFAVLENGRFSKTVRPAVYAAICSVIMFLISLACNAIVGGSADALGVFLPLTALDTMVFMRLVQTTPLDTIGEGLAAGAGTACAFAAAALPAAFIRGLIGGGIFFGSYVFEGIPALRSPFFGFILCGFIIVLFKRISALYFNGRGGEEDY